MQWYNVRRYHSLKVFAFSCPPNLGAWYSVNTLVTNSRHTRSHGRPRPTYDGSNADKSTEGPSPSGRRFRPDIVYQSTGIKIAHWERPIERVPCCLRVVLLLLLPPLPPAIADSSFAGHGCQSRVTAPPIKGKTADHFLPTCEFQQGSVSLTNSS